MVSFLHLFTLLFAPTGAVIDFISSKASPVENLLDVHFVSRVTLPYGPDLYGDDPQKKTDRPFRGYGFGMNAAEDVAYDKKNHYFYAASAEGFVTITDYSNPAKPKVTDFAVDVSEKGVVNFITLCPDKNWFFVAIDGLHAIQQFTLVDRENPQEPVFTREIPINSVPSQLLLNLNCTILAISNENSDEILYGTVEIVRELDSDEPTATTIPMDKDDDAGWDDLYALSKGLHMPMTKKALEYWDDHSHMSDDLDFSVARENYRSSIFIQGESLAWGGPAESELLVNLQVNNGVLRIDVTNNRALALAGYGLKDHAEIPIDINSGDKACNLKTYENLFSMRNPDTIETLRYDGKLYLQTANEGDNKEYLGWEDEIKAQKLFKGSELSLSRMVAPTHVLDPNDPLGGPAAALFNSDCEGEDCVGKVKLSVGSTAIDYDLDPTRPTLQRMVLFGGRGWTIYELPENPDELLKTVFDSGDDMERTSCELYPWAYNSQMDEEFAPTTNLPNNTFWKISDEDVRDTLLEMNDPEEDGCEDQGDGTPGACPLSELVDKRSTKDGVSLERIATGVACGRLVSVVTSEKNSIAWIYDITIINDPHLVKTFHLSPASETKSPGLAYNDGELGEVDPENFYLLNEYESPTGKPALMVAGAYSGTVSYWEFECQEYGNYVGEESTAGQSSSSSSSSSFAGSRPVNSFVLGTAVLTLATLLLL